MLWTPACAGVTDRDFMILFAFPLRYQTCSTPAPDCASYLLSTSSLPVNRKLLIYSSTLLLIYSFTLINTKHLQ